jgi:DNA-binding transcriptional ArsR family regulator
MVKLYDQAATIPMQFFSDERYESMSNNAKLLYGLLAERLEREIEQEDYSGYCHDYGIPTRDANKDESGNIYITYPTEELAAMLNVSKSTVSKLFKELEAANLIKRRRRGLGKPDNIYVGLA